MTNFCLFIQKFIFFSGRAYLTWNYADTDEINYQKADWIQIERKTTASTQFELTKALTVMGIQPDLFYEAVQQEEFQVHRFLHFLKLEKILYTVRLRVTRPQVARTPQIHVFLGPKFFQLHGFTNIGHSFTPQLHGF